MRRTPVRSRPRPQSKRPADPGLSRLQKILAAAGLGSRRQCETLILEGRVEVDRQVVSKLGAKADPFRQEVRVDGNVLPQAKKVYYLVNKPPGVLSTNRDPAGRPRVVDLLAPRGQRLFAVGRLDMSSEGLMLVTNDGELANLLTHPRYGVHKTYHVEVAGAIEREDLARVEEGMYLAEGFARVVGARIKTRLKKSTLLEITLDEGRNREIRRLLARTGHKVLRLRRVAIGPLRLGEMPLGASRPLSPHEVAALWHWTTPEARKEREKQEKARATTPRRGGAKTEAAQAKAGADAKPTVGAANRPGERSERGAGHGAKPAGPAHEFEPVEVRLPREPLANGDGPQRRVIIGGDSSSYFPRVRQQKAAGKQKARTRHGDGARPTAAVVTKARGKGKAGRGTKAAPRPVGAGRGKRRGAGRGESGA